MQTTYLTHTATMMKISDILTGVEFKTSSLKKKIDGRMETIQYKDVVLTLDIETTSYYNKDDKRAIMYIWQMSVNGEIIIGRTWDELTTTINQISDHFDTHFNKRVVIYVHNFAYEFGFLAKWFDWENIFALDVNKPVRALTTRGIEFRCSYILSGLALKYIPDQIVNKDLRVNKMVGDLDYKLIRNSLTTLTDKEMEYCINDVKILHGYISEKMIDDGGMAKIKLTNTSYVRDYVRNKCLPSKIEHITNRKDFTKEELKDVTRLIKNKWHSYKRLMENLVLTKTEYILNKKAFGGGHTHAAANRSDKMIDNVDSFDETSEYPTKILADKFPMGRGRIVNIKNKEEVLHNEDYCFVFEVEIKDLELKETVFDCYISESKLDEKSKDCIFDNGRLYYGSYIKLAMTNVDLQIIIDAYNIGEVSISNCYSYKMDYLPKPIIESILHFYEGKTTLKGLDDKVVEYTRLKGMLNSVYGMMVTDIAREDIEYCELRGWLHEEPDLYETIEKYNKSTTRFLFYPWGVFITAYARRDLWGLIIECGEDYIYSDTDSVKMVNVDKHINYINNYNTKIKEDLTKMVKHYNIDENKLHPKNVKGVEKWVGVWDYEGQYKHFKTLGAKRYMVQHDDDSVEITVSGVAKPAVDYLIKEFGTGEKLFDAFSDKLVFPIGTCGKSIHTYKNEGFSDIITDYQGNTCEHIEKSFIHLEETGYSLKVGDEYSRFLQKFIESDEEIM